jgi:segregation and condensation protein B
MLMIESYVRNVIEAALLAAGRPLTLAELGQLFDETARPDEAALAAALEQLAADYAERAIEVKHTASGWRIQVRREFAAEVSRLWPERPARYSRALLETLALIAYRQPITRGEIEDVRGVAVNPNIVKTLLERNWVRVVGQRDVPGRPELLGTTREFLDYFGLSGLDDLPPLAELKALTDLNLQLDLAASAAVPESDAAADAPGDGAADAAASAEGAAGASDETAAPADAPQGSLHSELGAQPQAEPIDAEPIDAEPIDAEPIDAEHVEEFLSVAAESVEDTPGDLQEDAGEPDADLQAAPQSDAAAVQDDERAANEEEEAPRRQMQASADGESD